MTERIGDLKIVAIGGSLRENSCCYLALEHLTQVLIRLGYQTRIFDLRIMRLPFCDGYNQDPSPDYPAVGELRRAVSSAHALVLATPEYHGSVSGVLKNALDLLSVEHLRGKVAGVIGVLGGATNSNALNDLTRMLRCCHAWVLPDSIAIARAQSVFRTGTITDADLLGRFNDFARRLVWSAARLSEYNEQVTQTKRSIRETFNSLPAVFQSAGESTRQAS
jgi:NAD(P)H-dependent FMN reductase